MYTCFLYRGIMCSDICLLAMNIHFGVILATMMLVFDSKFQMFYICLGVFCSAEFFFYKYSTF